VGDRHIAGIRLVLLRVASGLRICAAVVSAWGGKVPECRVLGIVEAMGKLVSGNWEGY